MSVIEGIVNWNLKMMSVVEVSAVKYPLHRFGYKILTVISSVPEKSFCFREVAARKDVRYTEVPLYSKEMQGVKVP